MKFSKTSTPGAIALACIVAGITFDVFGDETNKNVIEEVVVRAHPLSAEGLAQPISILKADELQRVVAASIGETLINLPGIHSSSFGQAVGRPVIRGLGGPRVKTMEDRIDSLDVSVSSPDHVATIEPFTADSIEVLKGPSTLLYGSGAIGGVVDVHTGRIPHQVPEKVSATVELRDSDNADQQTATGRLDTGTGNFGFHIDAFYRDADEYDIPGFAESSAQRALEEEEGEHDEHEDEHDEHEGEDHVVGNLPGSELRAEGGALGASYISERGFIGVAVSTYDAEYGLPGHSHAHHDEDEHHEDAHGEEEHGEAEHGEEEGTPILDLEQTRVDLEAGLEAPLAGVRKINLRMGFNDYEHVEFEEGEPGTEFSTEALEARLELTHEPFWGISGATGVQLSSREFSAIGEEAFVLPVDTETWGLFYVGQRDFGSLGVEAGVRYEHVDHDPTAGASRSFDLAAVSLGLIQPLGESWTLSGQLDYSSRAPVAEELYSDGPHLATQSYEIGDDSLDEEVARNLSVNLRYQQDSLEFTLSAYVTEFSDFIFEANTGMEIDELPVLQWTQADVTYHGFEADMTWQAMNWSNGALALTAGFDRVRGRLESGANRDLPRIPPQRWRLGAIVNWRNLLAEVTWRQIDDQDDTATGELPTEGYDDLRVHLAYTLDLDRSRVELFVSGRNLTDDEQRYHTSFIKDLAPQPGRTIEGGVRILL